MKVGIYSPYFGTYGGGERYVLTAAEFFLGRGDRVDIYETGGLNKDKVKDFFGIDISKANLISGKKTTFGYDLFFFLSDGGIPFSFAKKNILHFQTPLKYANQKTLANKIKLCRFAHFICNSALTKNEFDRTYAVDSSVIYPPVDIKKFRSGKKENLILSVGRFTSPTHANSKKQEILIEAFKELNIPRWKFVLFGWGDASYFEKFANGENIEIISDGDLMTLQKYYSKAKIYWHAAGFGEDLEKFPDRAEHFGITTVEAMAAGAVPVVFGAGGQKEIVEEGISGFFWKNRKDLISQTVALANDQNMRQRLSQGAENRAKMFSKEVFFQKLAKICAS